MGRTLYVDGEPRDVKGEGRELHGFVDLFVGDAGSPRIHARHMVPVPWWRDPMNLSGVRTGGHLYTKRPPTGGLPDAG